MILCTLNWTDRLSIMRICGRWADNNIRSSSAVTRPEKATCARDRHGAGLSECVESLCYITLYNIVDGVTTQSSRLLTATYAAADRQTEEESVLTYYTVYVGTVSNYNVRACAGKTHNFPNNENGDRDIHTAAAGLQKRLVGWGCVRGGEKSIWNTYGDRMGANYMRVWYYYNIQYNVCVYRLSGWSYRAARTSRVSYARRIIQ